jgi:hypothetical protein
MRMKLTLFFLWGAWNPALTRFHLFCVLLTHGKKRTQPRATALPWGLLGFLWEGAKTNKPHQNEECAGTWFPHAPTGDTH